MTASATLDPNDPRTPARLRALLDQGRLVVLPTDTVPGLAVSAQAPSAQARLAAIKGSPVDRPFTLHLRDRDELRALVPLPPPGLAAWLTRVLPGPTTVVLPKAWVALPRHWDWPWPSVGLRLPDDAGWRAATAGLDAPLLATSVNDAGEAPRTGAALAAWLDEHPEVTSLVDPAAVRPRAASTVVAFTPSPEVRRDESGAGLPALPGRRVLCVCTGNTCRSPLAEHLLRRELAAAWGVDTDRLHELGWHVASAGTAGLGGGPASEGSVAAAAEQGIDLSAHRSRSLDEVLAEGDVDLVLGMTESHLAVLPAGLPAELFDPRGRTIPDPFGAPVEAYRRTRDVLQEAAVARVRAFSAWPERG